MSHWRYEAGKSFVVKPTSKLNPKSVVVQAMWFF